MKQNETKAEQTKRWVKYAEKHLLGKKVVKVRYLTDDEADNLGWRSRSIVIFFDDGTYVFPSADDEGNNAGALFGTNKDLELTFPVLY